MSSLMQNSIIWREIFIRFALCFFCLVLWRNDLNLLSFSLLGLAWLFDGGLQKLGQIIKEPLVQAILVLCFVLLLGLFWSDQPEAGRMKWRKYFILLIFIPFRSLLDEARLPWVIGALLISYFSVLFMGIYQWAVLEEQGVSFFKMSYLSFSAMLGIGVILTVYLAGTSNTIKEKIFLWFIALSLLFLQFHQNGRSLLFATVIAILLLVFLLYKIKIRKFLGVLILLMTAISIFAFSSAVFQDRLIQTKRDMALLQQGDYSTSMGYRFAMWDVGLDGIAKRPLLGHGTGMAESYFENTIVTYKGGIYKDLPKFQRTSHYHNDWIELGMHVGVLGILALAFLLWGWYQTFKVHHLSTLGIAIISYIFLAGLTDTFIIYSRIPALLLVITAIVICWQKENRQFNC